MKYSGWFIAALIILASCLDDPDCFGLNNTIVGISFRVLGSSNQTAVSFGSVTVNDVLMDTVLVNRLPVIFDDEFTGGVVNFEVDPFKNSSVITFNGFSSGLETNKTKSVILNYTVKSQFVSEDCGARFIVSDLTATSDPNDFAEVRIVNSTAGNGGGVNVELYRCPITNIVGVEFRKLTINGTTIGSNAAEIDIDQVSSDYGFGLPAFTAEVVPLLADTTKEFTSYVFDIGESSKTLMLNYSKNYETRYPACKGQTFITDITVDTTQSTFDSLRIYQDVNQPKRDDSSDPLQVNVQIYECPETNFVKIDFRRAAVNGNTSETLYIQKITSGAGILIQDTLTSSVTLPLDNSVGVNNTSFTMEYKAKEADVNTITETITVNYKNETSRFKKTCPNARFLTLQSVTDSRVTGDNLKIVQSAINSPPVTNIQIIHQP